MASAGSCSLTGPAEALAPPALESAPAPATSPPAAALSARLAAPAPAPLERRLQGVGEPGAEEARAGAAGEPCAAAEGPAGGAGGASGAAEAEARAQWEWRAAGVLPFSVSASGEVLVLLGSERGRPGPSGRRRSQWSDFGGCRERCDADAEATAAREFAEETLGLFAGPAVDAAAVQASARHMAARLRRRPPGPAPPLAAEPGREGAGTGAQASEAEERIVRVEAPIRNGVYTMFLAEVQYIDPLMFQLATQHNLQACQVPGGEKTAFAWVKGSKLVHAVRRQAASIASAPCVPTAAQTPAPPAVPTLAPSLLPSAAPLPIPISAAASDGAPWSPPRPAPTPAVLGATSDAPDAGCAGSADLASAGAATAVSVVPDPALPSVSVGTPLPAKAHDCSTTECHTGANVLASATAANSKPTPSCVTASAAAVALPPRSSAPGAAPASDGECSPSESMHTSARDRSGAAEDANRRKRKKRARTVRYGATLTGEGAGQKRVRIQLHPSFVATLLLSLKCGAEPLLCSSNQGTAAVPRHPSLFSAVPAGFNGRNTGAHSATLGSEDAQKNRIWKRKRREGRFDGRCNSSELCADHMTYWLQYLREGPPSEADDVA